MSQPFFWKDLLNEKGLVYHTRRKGKRKARLCYTHRSADELYTIPEVVEHADLFPAFFPRRRSAWSMDSGDEGGDGANDVIDTVARVNTMHIDNAPVLPEIRAAPCPIHSKRTVKGLESGQFSKDFKSPRRVPFQSVKNISLQQNHPSQSNNAAKPHRVDISVRIPEQFPARAPSLPKNMTSKDYVMTWLVHGSDPQNSNHFPDIIPANSTKSTTKHSPRKAHVSE